MGIDAEMLLRINQPVMDEEIAVWSYSIAETLGAGNFFIQRDGKNPQGAISRVALWEQDGPDIEPKEGESFLRLHFWSRYWGPGYERGDLLFLISCAEWAEQNIPDCEVWYGGDSSGVTVELWPATKREEFKRHFYSPSGRDYYKSFDSGDMFAHEQPDISSCSLCIPGARPIRFGWGADYRAYRCHGCGYYFTTRDGGATWKVERERER